MHVSGLAVSSYLDKRFRDLPDPIPTRELARLFGKHLNTIYVWLREGKIPSWPVGDTYVVFKDELREFMEAERAAMLAGDDTADPDLILDDEDPPNSTS